MNKLIFDILSIRYLTMKIVLSVTFFVQITNLINSIPLNITKEDSLDVSAIGACKKRPKLAELKKNEFFDVIEIETKSRLSLACNFCDEPDDYTPKVWSKQDRFKENNITEIELEVKDILIENRIYMKPDHTLVINQVTVDDLGYYYCGGMNVTEFQIIYLVDALKSSSNITFGSTKRWKDFVEQSYIPFSSMFLMSNRSDFLEIRQRGIGIHIHSEWLPWSTCDGCKKIRMRLADCRLQPTLLNNSMNEVLNRTTPLDRSYNTYKDTLVKAFKFSCFSMDFHKYYPNISKDLQKLGVFAMRASCYRPCKFQFKSSLLPRYKNLLTLGEGDHFKFTCPESDLTNEILWRKDGKIIDPVSRNENLYLDSFHSLHITSASEEDAGNYTCYVDNVRMQEIIVIVNVNKIIGHEEFSRHLMYLGVLFSLYLLMYMSGIILSWKRRHAFMQIDFSELRGKYSDNLSL